MRGLFIEWSLAMVIAVVLSFVAVHQIATNSIEQYRTTAIPPFGDLLATQLWDFTDGKTGDELDAAITLYGDRLGAPVALRGIDAEYPEYVGDRLRDGLPGWTGGRDGVSIYVPLHDGANAVVIGPVQGVFEPDPLDLIKVIVTMLVIVAISTTIPLIPTVRRLRRLEQAAQAIGEGDLSARVPVRRPDAIGKLEGHFNTMASRVEELMTAQRGLIQAVAHEIRTPLARIQFGAEMYSMASDDDERQRRAAVLQAELEELDGLVGELLTFTRYDHGTAELARETIDVGEAVAEQVAYVQQRFGETTFVIEGGDNVAGIEVEAHPRSFHRVLRNLLSNAARYANNSVVVHIARDGDGHGVTIQVDDDGPGVPAAERERVFEPFVRVDDSRDRSTGGVGLGLAIVKRIMEVHAGEVRVEDSPSGGARFITRWPVV